jgi:hypothetical protein
MNMNKFTKWQKSCWKKVQSRPHFHERPVPSRCTAMALNMPNLNMAIDNTIIVQSKE